LATLARSGQYRYCDAPTPNNFFVPARNRLVDWLQLSFAGEAISPKERSEWSSLLRTENGYTEPPHDKHQKFRAASASICRWENNQCNPDAAEQSVVT
jgi:hypothetical protein